MCICVKFYWVKFILYFNLVRRKGREAGIRRERKRGRKEGGEKERGREEDY